MDTQESKILTLKDCKIDWKNHPAEDENGNPIIEDWTEFREQWLHENCECNTYVLADQERCFRYFTIDLDTKLFEQYMQQAGYIKSDVAYLGLVKMFNDDWIKSPAFVIWQDFFYLQDVYCYCIQHFVDAIYNPDMRVRIIKYFIDNADYLYGKKEKQKYIPKLKNLLIIHSEAAKIHQQKLKQQTAIDISQKQQVDLLKEIAILKERIIKLEHEQRVINNFHAPVSQVVNTQNVDNLTTK